MDSVIPQIRRRYQIGLLAIALLISGSFLLMQYIFSVQKSDAQVINVAGKQRMLSQKIAWHSHTLLQPLAEDRQAQHQQSLQVAIRQFKQGQVFLLQTDKQGNRAYFNNALAALYFAKPEQLNLHAEQFIEAAQQLANQPHSTELPSALTLANTNQLLVKLDLAVSLFEQQATNKVTLVSYFELAFWLLALGLLLLEIKFIFRPMERHIASSLDKYKQQKRYAEQINNNKAHFIARASHEFRTPLQGLNAAIDNLQVTDAQQKIKQQAKFCSARLLAMLDELHDLQNLMQGSWALKPSEQNLLATLEEIAGASEFAFTEKQITFNTHLDPQLNCTALIDHARLQQIVFELLSNALKFTKRGSVTLSACFRKGNQLHLEVIDTGQSFAGKYPYLDNPVDSQQQHFQGLQTGLARVQYIVAVWQGSVSFLDTQAGGANVTVNLPINVISQSTLPSQPPKNLTCLIVEDNPLNAMLMERILAGFNYAYDVASNGLIATQMVTEKTYDVIFMDLNMPVMDGFNAIAIMREELAITQPIIVVTANTSDSDIERCYQVGATHHLFKPFDAESIKSALLQLVLN